MSKQVDLKYSRRTSCWWFPWFDSLTDFIDPHLIAIQSTFFAHRMCDISDILSGPLFCPSRPPFHTSPARIHFTIEPSILAITNTTLTAAVKPAVFNWLGRPQSLNRRSLFDDSHYKRGHPAVFRRHSSRAQQLSIRQDQAGERGHPRNHQANQRDQLGTWRWWQWCWVHRGGTDDAWTWNNQRSQWRCEKCEAQQAEQQLQERDWAARSDDDGDGYAQSTEERSAC